MRSERNIVIKCRRNRSQLVTKCSVEHCNISLIHARSPRIALRSPDCRRLTHNLFVFYSLSTAATETNRRSHAEMIFKIFACSSLIFSAVFTVATETAIRSHAERQAVNCLTYRIFVYLSTKFLFTEATE